MLPKIPKQLKRLVKIASALFIVIIIIQSLHNYGLQKFNESDLNSVYLIILTIFIIGTPIALALIGAFLYVKKLKVKHNAPLLSALGKEKKEDLRLLKVFATFSFISLVVILGAYFGFSIILAIGPLWMIVILLVVLIAVIRR